MKKLYLVSELKNLKIGDKLFFSYKGRKDNAKGEGTISYVDNDGIYIDTDYGTFDFPLQPNIEVTTPEAIQDSGDYVFKLFKV